MGTYIGKVQLNNNIVSLGDTLYGTCNTPASTPIKSIVLPDLDKLINGIQIRIRFDYGNTVTSNMQLSFPNTNIPNYYVFGDCTCTAHDVISFTWELNENNAAGWRVVNSGVSEAIKNYVTEVARGAISAVDVMVFKGTIGTNGTINSVPNGSQGHTYKIGDTYRVVTAGNYIGQECEIGDLLIAINNSQSGQAGIDPSHWTIAQTNLDGTVIGPTNSIKGHIATFSNTTGKNIEDSGYTIETSVPANAVFTDENTSYQYSLTNTQTANAYTGTTTYDSDNATSKVLVSASNGVLYLEEGITFTTTAAMTSVTLNENAVAGPSVI